MNYWLDKVFPNKKLTNDAGELILDKNGDPIVSEWLTPWCYEICMDWSHYSVEGRKSNKMYEDSYVTSWGVLTTSDQGGKTISEQLVSKGFEKGREKARYVDCKNSNKYNITQNIAKAFEVFCQYEYKCDMRGRFLHEYFEKVTTEDGQTVNKAWTGRKVIFYNRAIKTDNPVAIEYKKNLDSISRTKDSSEVYTKMYVTPIETSTTDTGYISIADTALNPTLDEFILNFDYLYQTKAISQYQLNFVKTYEVEIHKINQELINLSPVIEDLTVRINDLQSNLTMVENERSSAQKSLEEYQVLRDSEVRQEPIQKNESNPFSVVFVEDGDIKKASFRLYGIDKTTLTGYSNYTYNTKIFSFSDNDLLQTRQVNSVTTDDPNFYFVCDEYGYPETIYASKDNEKFKKDNSSIIYLSLEYSPYNAYDDICKQLEQRINSKEISIELLKDSIEELETDLKKQEKIRDEKLTSKDELNRKLEYMLGPALREGYWTPDTSYEDQGESKIVEDIPKQDNSFTGAVFKFDNEPFEGEKLNYYYADSSALDAKNKTYYPYISLNGEYQNWANKNLNDLVLCFQKQKYFSYNNDATFGKGGCSILIVYNGKNHYFKVTSVVSAGSLIELYIDETLELRINGNIIPKEDSPSSNNIRNLTANLVSNTNGNDLLLYNDAGFFHGFLKDSSGKIIPVLVIDNLDIDFSQYTGGIQYSFRTENEQHTVELQTNASDYTFVYPRIIVYDSNVNYKSDRIKLIPYETNFTIETQELENYKDYSILVRNGKPCFNLKITQNNSLNKIMDWHYRIEYRISRANEMLYLDAKNVARDNSHPKYSYDLKVANIPGEIGFYELGQLVYINDFTIGIHAASGYVSSITLHLDKIQEDEVQIKNYKTKFEDLFSTITASSEAMRNNQHSYNIAAGSFNSDGTISGSVLQNSILNNSISMNYSNTNVEIDDTNGIVLTNSQPYLNGVYGQVKLIGGGIFLSNAIDASGARIWNTGITPNGINAALINAGQLDVEKIRIFAGNNVAFQWNSEGIFAYQQLEDGVDLNTYVRYSDKGLQFISHNHTTVDLGWNGLLISTQDGSTELTGKYGLVIYDGQKKFQKDEDLAYNHVVRLGKFDNGQNSYEYGLKLYKRTVDDQYIENLVATNSGDLWLKDTLIVGSPEEITWKDSDGKIHTGSCIAGLSGTKDPIIKNEKGELVAGSSVRFWAGRTEELKYDAPFRVLQDGTLFASSATITGTIYATDGEFTGTINANEGNIGGWTINQDSLSTDGIKLQANTPEKQASIVVGDTSSSTFVTISGDGALVAEGVTINGTINASGGTIGNFEIADINTAIGAVGDITANMNNITVEIISSNGNITKYGENFSTELKAIIKRGGFEIKEQEYSEYKYEWKYSDDGKKWFLVGDSDGTRSVNYTEIHTGQRYIKCFVSKEEVSSNGDAT